MIERTPGGLFLPHPDTRDEMVTVVDGELVIVRRPGH